MFQLTIRTPLASATHAQAQADVPGRGGSADAWLVEAAATTALRTAILKDVRRNTREFIATSRRFFNPEARSANELRFFNGFAGLRCDSHHSRTFGSGPPFLL